MLFGRNSKLTVMLRTLFLALLVSARCDLMRLKEGRSSRCLMYFFFMLFVIHCVVENCMPPLFSTVRLCHPGQSVFVGKDRLLCQPLDLTFCCAHVAHQHVVESDGAFLLVKSDLQILSELTQNLLGIGVVQVKNVPHVIAHWRKNSSRSRSKSVEV